MTVSSVSLQEALGEIVGHFNTWVSGGLKGQGSRSEDFRVRVLDRHDGDSGGSRVVHRKAAQESRNKFFGIVL